MQWKDDRQKEKRIRTNSGGHFGRDPNGASYLPQTRSKVIERERERERQRECVCVCAGGSNVSLGSCPTGWRPPEVRNSMSCDRAALFGNLQMGYVCDQEDLGLRLGLGFRV